MTEHSATDADLTPEERDALARARQDRDAPPEVLQAVVADLRRRGLLRRERTNVMTMRAAAWAAGLAAAFVAGLLAAPVLRPASQAPAPAGARFMLLLYEDEGFRPGGPEDHARRVREYSAWARSLAADGRLAAGDELAEERIELTQAGVRDPTAGTAATVLPSGYFVIVAPDQARAVDIALTCPHLREGGRVVVRRIVG